MGANTLIQWASHTFNHVRGCTKVATGCQNCYAESQSKRNSKVLGIWGPNGTRVVASEAMWREPKKWNSAAARDGVRRRVFCASLADVFEDWNGRMCYAEKGEDGQFANTVAWWRNDIGVCRAGQTTVGHVRSERLATMSDCRRDLFRLIDSTPNLDWLLLTKQPENIRKMWPAAGNGKDPGSPNYLRRENVWLGTSIACQEDADRNVPLLLKCRDMAPVLWLSVEPLISQILPRWLRTAVHARMKPDWIVVGGESGPNARPCNVWWIRQIVRKCRQAGVPVFVKQMGSHVLDHHTTSASTFHESECWPAGTKTDHHRILLRDSKGGDMSEWPEDLRVREFPGVASR